jgi:hypothetical protein
MAASLSRPRSRKRPGLVPKGATNPILEYKNEMLRTLKDNRFVVFLCGPSLKKKKDPGARIRRQIMQRLKKENIDVRLGEDDGLQDVRMQFQFNAQDNELEFICHSCDAIIVVAGSVGSFCELGLFSWHYAHKTGKINKSGDKDFIVLIEKKYGNFKRPSYLAEGPVRAVLGFGMVSYGDFEKSTINIELDNIIRRVLERRATHRLDRRGRPRKNRGRSLTTP